MPQDDETLVKLHEGLRLKPYHDTVGAVTIGWGRNLSGDGISVAEAQQLFDSDMNAARNAAAAIASVHGVDWPALTDARRAALVDMAFNLGYLRLQRFERMWQALAVRDFQAAAREMRASLWAAQVGGRAEEDAAMMESGEFPGAAES